jgi:surface antigen
MECVPYARARSGLALYGDAGTWWDKAEGHYAKRQTPRPGSVIVLTGYAGPGRGHVGVVTALVSAREIRLDHANWLGDGAIYIDDPVVDVSPENDWSEVRVWNPRTTAWGRKTYLVEGFIGPDPVEDSDRIAAE